MKKLALIAALTCTGAHAEFLTGNDLLARIKNDNLFSQGVGLGYVMGAFDAGHGITHCAPANVTAGQVQDVVKQHFESVPAARNLSAEANITYILGKTWPCAKKGTSL